ncbi:MAG TPA: FAD-binding protein, partial [Burkholderiaceae bacterium]|nr:FAD-binding protein [Burkholderiaceae bacterium]
ARLGLARRWARVRGDHPEAVIQDVDIPIEHAGEFLEFLLREIGIVPIWLCPLRAPVGTGRFALYPLADSHLYVNFGFWDTVHSRRAHEPGYFNRLVEREVIRLAGIKSLYSDSFFTREEFDAAYGMAEYDRLKARYDPHGRLLGLYEKCVQRA